MDFFEKAQARAHAQEVLGLAAHPDLEDIKAAYKQLARKNIPTAVTVRMMNSSGLTRRMHC